MKKFRVIFIVAALLILLRPAQSLADSYIITPPHEVIRGADLIVEAIVLDVTFYPFANNGVGYADITLEILDVIKGKSTTPILIRRYGVDKDTFRFTDCNPSYIVGQEAIISLLRDDDGFYLPLGLLNGTLYIDNGKLKGTNIEKSQLKTWIREILDNVRDTFPSTFPDLYMQYKNKLSASNSGDANKVLKMNNSFESQGDSWDFGDLPVVFKYNHDGAPAGSSSTTVIDRIEDAMAPWNNLSHSVFEFDDNITTTEYGDEEDDTNVIVWANLGPGTIAGEATYPSGQGIGTITESDIVFNSYYNADYYFGSSPLANRSGDIDYSDVLMHELGHTQGLDHPNNTGVIMYYMWDYCTYTPLRTLADGDKAGAVYQHPHPTPSGNTSHDILLGIGTTEINNVWYVGSGQTLKVEPLKTIEFGTSGGIFSYGTVVMDGSVGEPITLTKSGANNWDYLYFYGSGTSGSVIDYVTIEYSDHGIHTNNPGSLSLDHITAQNNYYQGLKIYNSASVTVTNSTFNDATYYGAYIDDSDNIRFKDSELSDNGTDGIRVLATSTAFFGDYHETGNVTVYNNGSYGLYAYGSSSLVAGYGEMGGDNNVYSNSTYDAAAVTYGVILAEDTYWGSSSPSPSQFYTATGGGIDYNPYLTSPAKTGGPDGLGVISATASFVRSVYELKKHDRAGATSLINASMTHANPDVAKTAKVMRVRDLLSSASLFEGIVFGESLLLETGLEPEDKAMVAKQLFYAYLLELSDFKNAERSLSLLYALDEEDANNGLLMTIFTDVSSITPKIDTNILETVYREGIVLDNYPNPFNPETTIRYFLPKAMPVTLKVFDVLGREVAILIEGEEAPGIHYVLFDASHLGSGVYLYRLNAGNKVQSGTMMLMK